MIGYFIGQKREMVPTNPIKAMAAIIDVLFFAVPPTMKPMKRSTFPPMINHRRPKRSELAPQILCSCQYVTYGHVIYSH